MGKGRVKGKVISNAMRLRRAGVETELRTLPSTLVTWGSNRMVRKRCDVPLPSQFPAQGLPAHMTDT